MQDKITIGSVAPCQLLRLAFLGDPSGKRTPFIEKGLFSARQGQLNLARAQCHGDNWGKALAGIPIPQAHSTGYPLYRLEWQALGSLQRRLRNCMIGIRAEPYPHGAPEYLALPEVARAACRWKARRCDLDAPK